MDLSYNFMDDVLGKEIDPKNCEFNEKPWKINEENYKDPDKHSNKLYEYHKEIWNKWNEKLKLFELKKCGKELCFTCKRLGITKIRLGSDYIGPSIAWAHNVGVSNEDIGEYIQSTRTIGGFILFPRHRYSINQARGGRGGFFDRIDITLYDLKSWYDGKNCKLKKAYDMDKVWLEFFSEFYGILHNKVKVEKKDGFKGFIEFFCLEDFVNKDYVPYDLTTYEGKGKFSKIINDETIKDCKISEKEKYIKFIEGSEYVIGKRQEGIKKRIIEFLSGGNCEEIL